MLWVGVDLTAVIPCLEVSQLSIFVSCNVCKIIWLEVFPTPVSIHTSLLLGRLSIGCPLNTVPYSRLPLLVNKFLHSSYPKYFVPFLKPRHSVYNTSKIQAAGVVLEIPHFTTSVYVY